MKNSVLTSCKMTVRRQMKRKGEREMEEMRKRLNKAQEQANLSKLEAVRLNAEIEEWSEKLSKQGSLMEERRKGTSTVLKELRDQLKHEKSKLVAARGPSDGGTAMRGES